MVTVLYYTWVDKLMIFMIVLLWAYDNKIIMSRSSAPQLIPSFLFTGEQQHVIVEFKHDLPPGISIITLTFRNTQFFRERIPVTPIGPKAIKAFFPAFTTSGTYSVVPKFDHEEKPMFPCFDVKILSPLEALKLSVLPSSIKSAADYPGSVAAILAYLIKTEASNTQENIDIVDDILLSSVQKIGVPFSDISTFLSGQHGPDNLLHYALRRRLSWTSDWLSNPEVIPSYVAPQWFQSPSNIDGLKPAEIARQVGLHKTAEQIDEQVKRCGPWQPDTGEEKSSGGTKSKMKTIKNAFKRATDVKDTVTKTANVANYAMEKAGEANDFAQNAQDLASGIASVDIEVPPVLGEIKDAIDIAGDVKDISKKIIGVGKYIKKLKKKKSKSNTNPSNNDTYSASSNSKPSGGVPLAQNFISQLKDTALYTAQMSGPYTCSSESYGHINLKAGDFVHVIREDPNGMCKGIVQEKYCEFPRNLLQALENDDSEYDSESEEYDSDYEEVKYFDDSELDQNRQGTSPVKNMEILKQKMRSHSIESGLNHRVAPLPGLTKPDPVVKQPKARYSPPQSPLIKREQPPRSPAVSGKPIPPLPPLKKPSFNEKTTHDRPLPKVPNSIDASCASPSSPSLHSPYNKPKQHFFPPSTEHVSPREVIYTPSRIYKRGTESSQPVVSNKPTPPLPPKKLTNNNDNNKSSPSCPEKRGVYHEQDNGKYFEPIVHRNWSNPNTSSTLQESTPPTVPSKHNMRHESPSINKKQVEQSEDSPGLTRRALPSIPIQEKESQSELSQQRQWTPRPPYLELKKLNNNNNTKPTPPTPPPKHSSPSLTRTVTEKQDVIASGINRSPSLEKKGKKTPLPPPMRRDSSLLNKGDTTATNNNSPRLIRPPIKGQFTQQQIPIEDIDEEYDDTAQFRKVEKEEKNRKTAVWWY